MIPILAFLCVCGVFICSSTYDLTESDEWSPDSNDTHSEDSSAEVEKAELTDSNADSHLENSENVTDSSSYETGSSSEEVKSYTKPTNDSKYGFIDPSRLDKVELETILKRKNFVMCGIKEEAFEDIHDQLEIVVHVVNDVMKSNISTLEIDNVMRLGWRSAKNPHRPLLVKCMSEWRKDDILSRAHYLNGTSITVEPDLAHKSVMLRREYLMKGVYSSVEWKMISAREAQEARIKFGLRTQLSIKEYINYLKRKRNFVLCGLHRPGTESRQQLRKLVLDVLNKKMGVPTKTNELRVVMRLGKNKGVNVTRPILVKCVCYWKKYELWKNRLNLRGTHIFLEHDLRRTVLEQRGGDEAHYGRMRKMQTQSWKQNWTTTAPRPLNIRDLYL